MSWADVHFPDITFRTAFEVAHALWVAGKERFDISGTGGSWFSEPEIFTDDYYSTVYSSGSSFIKYFSTALENLVNSGRFVNQFSIGESYPFVSRWTWDSLVAEVDERDTTGNGFIDYPGKLSPLYIVEWARQRKLMIDLLKIVAAPYVGDVGSVTGSTLSTVSAAIADAESKITFSQQANPYIQARTALIKSGSNVYAQLLQTTNLYPDPSFYSGIESLPAKFYINPAIPVTAYADVFNAHGTGVTEGFNALTCPLTWATPLQMEGIPASIPAASTTYGFQSQKINSADYAICAVDFSSLFDFCEKEDTPA